MVEEQPKWRTGKICYVEIPAVDVARSAGILPAGVRLENEAER